MVTSHSLYCCLSRDRVYTEDFFFNFGSKLINKTAWHLFYICECISAEVSGYRTPLFAATHAD